MVDKLAVNGLMFGKITRLSLVSGVISSLFFILVACSSIDIELPDQKSAHQSQQPVIENTLRIKRLWVAAIGEENTEEFSRTVPAVSEQAIYTVSALGELKAWSLKKGKKLWRVDLEENITGGVYAGYGVILLGSSEGEVIALASENGEAKWKTQVQGEILSSPQTNGRIVVVQSANGMVHGLDLKSGEKKWTYQTNVPGLTLRGTSTPRIEKQVVYIGFANGKIAALDLLTGAALWDMPVHLPEGGSELERVVDVDGNILVDSNNVYAASYQGKIAALDKSTGRPRWKSNSSNFAGVAKGLGNIFSIETDGYVVAFDKNKGEQVWRQDLLQGRQLGAPSVQGNFIVIGDSEGFLYWLNQNDGKIVARKHLTRGSKAVFSTGHFKGLRKKNVKPKEFRVFAKSGEKNGILYVQNQFGVVAAYRIEK